VRPHKVSNKVSNIDSVPWFGCRPQYLLTNIVESCDFRVFLAVKDRPCSSKMFYLSSWQTLKEHHDSITNHCVNFREIHHEINPVEFTTMTITSGHHFDGTWRMKGC